MQEIDELSQAIKAVESQRATLGDSVVEAALAPLRAKLAELEQCQTASQHRRLVTVLFLDIVNSTLMSQGLEPEEVLEIMGGALKRLAGPIEAHGGKVIQSMGDGFMAVFGLSRVHENDARQAVRAGLAIITESQACAEDMVHRFQIPGFDIRIGINTGRIVTGRSSEGESPIAGLTVSLAARMEQAAQPGTLLISQFTHQHVRGAFDVETLPPVEAKGFRQPVAVYRVRAARPRTFRTFTRGVEGIETRLIGREAEHQQLQDAFTRAMQFQETQLVTIIGDAGVGKSRLLYEFDRWVAKAPSRVTAFKARGFPQTTKIPYFLLREMIGYHLGILTNDPVSITRRRLEEAMASHLDEESQMKAHFVGSLLGHDFSDSPHLQGVANDPRQLRERAHLYLIQYLTAVARETDTVLMLDDIHWADIPSMNFIAQLIRECPKLPLLVVCLSRPTLSEQSTELGQEEPSKLQPPIESLLAGSMQITLEPLSRQASRELLVDILGNVEGFPDTLYERILDSADGNPFYLEEFIQTLLDSNVICRSRQGGAWRLDPERSSSLDVPTTLTAVLEARMDNLSTAQRVLVQQASVIGRIFWRSALHAMRGGTPVDNAELKALSRRGFIHPMETSTFAGTEEYVFHHVLLRDVAYQTLLKAERKTYHGQVAAWLIEETQTHGRTGEFASIIAENFELAGERDLAADWYTQAGIRARNQGVPAQARTFFDRALVLLPFDLSLSPTSPNLVRRWQALAGRDEVLGILGDTEARMADDVALVALAESVGDDRLLAEAFYRQGYYLGMNGQYTKERETYIRGLEAARRANDRRREALILGLKVFCEVRLGDLGAAAQTSTAALTCAEDVGDDEVLARILTNISTFFTETGDMARTVQLLDRQLAINRRTGNLVGEMVGLSHLGYNYILLGMPEEAISTLQRCIEMAKTIGHRSFCAYGGINLALAYLRCGDPASTLSELEQYLPEMKAMNDMFGYAVGQTYGALAKEKGGEVNESLTDFEQAATTLGKIGTLGTACDAEAGIARCQLALNNLEAAQRHVDPLWDYLQRQAGAGMEFPILGYETCANVYSAAGQAALAQHVLDAGYHELMRRAERISLPEWRQSYLEKIPEHQRLLARWQLINETSQE